MDINYTIVEPIAPDSGTLLINLRNVGYTAHEAVADIVDNSIDAGATDVRISIRSDSRQTHVNSSTDCAFPVNITISDNGRGMNADDLLRAMSLAFDRSRDKKSLGKYGIGLKSAGLYLAQSLTVMSRTSTSEDFHLLRWVRHPSDERYILTSDSSPAGSELRDENRANTDVRTLVLLEEVYAHRFPADARTRRAEIAKYFDQELSLTFGRFLLGKARKVEMFIDELPLEGIDPVDTLLTSSLPKEAVGQGKVHLPPVYVQCAFTVEPEMVEPTHRRFKRSLPDGLYVYRNDRLLHSGNWLNARAIRHHHAVHATRVAVFSSSDHDELFSPSIAKNKVQIPPRVRDYIKHLPPRITRYLGIGGASAPRPNSVAESLQLAPRLDQVSDPEVRGALSVLQSRIPQDTFQELLYILVPPPEADGTEHC